ncbi:MAG: hypothetical protein ACRBF0_04625 [Calditrichia bacterium]
MKRMLILLAFVLASCASNPPDYSGGKIPFDQQSIDAKLIPIFPENIPEQTEASIEGESRRTFSLIPSRKSFDLISDYRFVTYVSGILSIDVFALDGRLVSNVFSGPLEAGAYDIEFLEKQLNSGVFVMRYRLEAHQQLFRTILLNE